VVNACNTSRHSDIEIQAILDQQLEVVLRQILNVVDAEVKSGTAQPISEDLPTLIRTLAGTTALVLTGDPLLVGRDNDLEDLERRVRVLEQLWLNALWGGPVR
jgi:hypothetical protein